jgi:hypothetical protein
MFLYNTNVKIDGTIKMDSSNRPTPPAAHHTSTAGQQFAFKKKNKRKRKNRAGQWPRTIQTSEPYGGGLPLHQSNSHLVLIRPSLHETEPLPRGIIFAEGKNTGTRQRALCRALGKEALLAKISLPRARLSAKISLPRARLSAKNVRRQICSLPRARLRLSAKVSSRQRSPLPRARLSANKALAKD